MSIFSGNETHIITLDDEHLHKDVEHSLILKPSNFCIPPDYPVGKEEFLDGLRELHIGEWRSNYDPRRFGYEVLNGTQWELEIFFSEGHKLSLIHISQTKGTAARTQTVRSFKNWCGTSSGA